MNLKELKTPIRIYWDLSGDSGVAVSSNLKIAAQIVGMKILSLDITSKDYLATASCLAVLGYLKEEQLVVSLTLPYAVVNADLIEKLSLHRLKSLYIQVTSALDLPSVKELCHEGAERKLRVGISYEVTRDNFRDLPELLNFCVLNSAPLVLPMQRLKPGADVFMLSHSEQQVLAEQLGKVNIPEKMNIIIHDPFLWRLFYPRVNFPNGRCQAANTMLHIAANGDVFPCPSLPVKLGNILETPLSTLAVSIEKNAVREHIISSPLGCQDCIDLGNCLGGCRGRAVYFTESWETPDPGCGGIILKFPVDDR
jgi:GeoRSP system SPASM domain protein